MRKIVFALIIQLVMLSVTSCKSVVEKSEQAIFTVYTFDEFGSPSGSGSGFFIESSGIGVTNYHVLDGSVKAIIKTQNDEFEIDSVLSSSRKKDLLVFRVNNTGKKKFATLSIANKRPEKGDKVINIGSPMGLENTLTEGIVSSYRTDSHGDIVQTTAAISAGCSGSPLMNKNGEVFAVVSFKRKAGENLNFGIVIDEKFREELDEKEFAKHNPKFNSNKSDFHILNLQCDNEICLMLNAIEFSKSATTAYFTFTNLHLANQNYAIFANVSNQNGFCIEDKKTGEKYYATSASISTDSNACEGVGLGEILQFKVYFPKILNKLETFDISSNSSRSSWSFKDINLDDYQTISIDDSKYYRELALMQLNEADDNNVANAIAETIETMSELISNNPEDGLSLNILGILYYTVENNLDALSAFSDAVDANPNDALSLENRALLYSKQGDYESALNDLNSAINLCPKNSKYLYYRGMIVLNQKEDPANALKDFERCLEIEGLNPYILEGRAVCYAMLGKRNAAMNDIQLAYRLSNDSDLDQRLQQLYNSL